MQQCRLMCVCVHAALIWTPQGWGFHTWRWEVFKIYFITEGFFCLKVCDFKKTTKLQEILMFQNSTAYSPTMNVFLQKRVDFICLSLRKKLLGECRQYKNKIKINDLTRIEHQTVATVLQSEPIFLFPLSLLIWNTVWQSMALNIFIWNTSTLWLTIYFIPCNCDCKWNALLMV